GQRRGGLPPPAAQGCALCLAAPPPSEGSPLSLHDALPISERGQERVLLALVVRRLLGREHRVELGVVRVVREVAQLVGEEERVLDRKSTRLNSSHVKTSYAVFCLKKKKPVTVTTARTAISK